MAGSSKYYKLPLNPLPRFPRAFSNRKENFAWQYAPDPDKRLCEIAFIQDGSICESLPAGEKNFPQGTVYTVIHDDYRRQFCPEPVYHEYVLRFCLRVPYERITEEEVAEWTPEPYCAIFPEHIDDPVACEKIANLLKQGVLLFQENPTSRILCMQAILCECLGILTEQAVLQAQHRMMHAKDNLSRVTQRICRYVKKHLSEKLPVREVARAVGANYDYASRVFREDMKMSMTEYINRSKIHRVEQLITVDGMTLEQAGSAIGIQDTKYLSRLFNRYTGMTVHEFRHIYHTRSAIGMTEDSPK